MNHWQQLLNPNRRKQKSTTRAKNNIEIRTELERDYDRILFSAPIRRLADKTQVFPLEKNDSVRTRLTHSHEVSNLARSVGINLAFNYQLGHEADAPLRDIPSVLAAIGLAHDIGNPPFGHQGEVAIQKWFQNHQDILTDSKYALTEAMKMDFLKFEGNAQTIRILTCLQLLNDDCGLNLTFGTLAALIKYPTPSDQTSAHNIGTKKHSFFQSEAHIIQEVWHQTGLAPGIRHPLTYIMESCDDIAYAVCDAEDSVKKGLVSFSDIISNLYHNYPEDPIIKQVCELADHKHTSFRKANLAPAELNDVSMQMFRVYAISAMMNEITQTFLKHQHEIMEGRFERDLLSHSDASALCKALKQFNHKHAYQHKSVLKIELTGNNTIVRLMDLLWDAITNRYTFEDPTSPRNTPFANYAYGQISENYRRIFESESNHMPIRYREAQLLTDMIAGMTDTYIISLCDELNSVYDR